MEDNFWYCGFAILQYTRKAKVPKVDSLTEVEQDANEGL
jgi:hypothetical protein